MRMLQVIKKGLKPPRHKDADNEVVEDDDLLDIEDTEESYEVGEITRAANSGADVQSDASDEEVSDTDTDDDGGGDDDDDEAMFRSDPIIVKIFEEWKNKAGGDSAHTQLVLFKLRVLSLVEIYLHENPGSTRVLTVYSNLVQAFVNPSTTEGSEQLSQRISGILQTKIFKAKDYPKGENAQLYPRISSRKEPLVGFPTFQEKKIHH